MKTINKKILFVCLGNICRSPTAEGIFRHMVNAYPELSSLEIDSCGTIGHHIGEPPDSRTVLAAKKRGYDLSYIRSRKITIDDLEYYDHLLAMDEENLSNLLLLAGENFKHHQKIQLFLDYAVETQERVVPDPYYGGSLGFDKVIDLVEKGSRGLIKQIKNA